MGGSVPKATIVVAASKSSCGGLVNSSCSGTNSGVFTIPANIPPPPQYCTTPCSELTPAQHSFQHSISTTVCRPHPLQQQPPCQSRVAGGGATLPKHLPHPHFHVNPHHQPLPQTNSHLFHTLQRPASSQSPKQGILHQPDFSGNTNAPSSVNQLRCCSPSNKLQCQQCPCPDPLMVRTSGGGSPHCCSSRPMSPNQQQLLQHQGRLSSSTPPPRLSGRCGGSSTPPVIDSTLNSPVASYSPLASSPQSQAPLSSATLPRQRSYDPPPTQPASSQHLTTTLHRQRSVTDAYGGSPQMPHTRSSSPSQKRNFSHLKPSTQRSLSPQSTVSEPSELNYVQPNPALPSTYSGGGGGGGNSATSSCLPASKVQWEGAPSGTGSDV